MDGGSPTAPATMPRPGSGSANSPPARSGGWPTRSSATTRNRSRASTFSPATPGPRLARDRDVVRREDLAGGGRWFRRDRDPLLGRGRGGGRARAQVRVPDRGHPDLRAQADPRRGAVAEWPADGVHGPRPALHHGPPERDAAPADQPGDR